MHTNKELLFNSQATFKGFINHLAKSKGSNLIVSDVHNVRAGKGYSQSKVYIDICNPSQWVVTITVDMSNYHMTGIKTLGKYPKKQADVMIDEATSFYFNYVTEGFNEINGTNAAKKQKELAEQQKRDYIMSLKSEVYQDFMENESLMDQYSNVEYYNNFITSHNVTDEDAKEILFNTIKRKYKRAGKEYQEVNNINELNPSKEENKESVNNQTNNSTQSNVPVTYHFYKQSFNNYMDAYNYAINNRSPVTMIIPSNHPYMSNERLQQLEHEYTFSKSNMSYDDMKEYFKYISELPISSDRDERYYKLQSYIKRYGYKQGQKEKLENERQRLSLEGSRLLVFMKEKGLQLKYDKYKQWYYYKGEHVYSFYSCSVEKYYNDMLSLFNKYFSQYADEFNKSKVYYYKGNENTDISNDNYPTGWISYNNNTHIATFNRELNESEMAYYNLIPYTPDTNNQFNQIITN